MISNVLYPYGRVKVPEQTTREEMYSEYGKNNEGYWTGEHLVNHITKVVILIFQLLYPLESI
ncbi:hypothetical protein L873DRAFT_1905860 [Choiromyces venosus 120613-1]|uniref:Uncharacterized protein n=1 Tax=Choiromyces venosus 120613-1 TaxID=1336337 RepID=A0A3N4IWL6_9PEZI|nr:hypothetical protein L873DRAFT_1905860 [Choiromyces venosus 120613-1]